MQARSGSEYAGHKASGFLWNIPFVNALTHDQLVRPDRFFPTSGSASMGASYRAVNAPQLPVNLLAIKVCGSHSIQFRIQSAITVPCVEQTINRSPRSVFRRNVTPGRPRSQNPKYRVHHDSLVARRPTSIGWCREKISNTPPLIVRKPVTRHDFLLALVKPINSLNYSRTFNQYQFSNRLLASPIQCSSPLPWQ